MKEIEKKDWSQMNWTWEAREILEKLKELPVNSKVALILRHSSRFDSRDSEKFSKLRLTPEGVSFAKYFGKTLPKNRPIHIYYSNSKRCKETALAIKMGFDQENSQKNANLMGEMKSLYNLDSNAIFVAKEMISNKGLGFLLKWKSNFYPPNKIMPFDEYYKQAAYEIWSNLINSNPNSLIIHITHDLHLCAMKLGWFGFSSEDWVSYLGGFGLSLEKNHIIFLENSEISRIEYPPWWIKRKNIIKDKGGEKYGKKP